MYEHPRSFEDILKFNTRERRNKNHIIKLSFRITTLGNLYQTSAKFEASIRR